jgi:predicted dehydrogenase
MKPLKVKILGSGNAAQKHARAFAELSELYQIVDSDDHDIVDICTPNYLHFHEVGQVIGSGWHAIVEKPICGSLDECDFLIDIERRTGKRIIPIFQYRFAGHALFDHGIINRWQRDKSYYEGWRGDWTKALGGCATSHAIHAIDLGIRLHGMPMMVSAGMNTSLGVETYADIFMGEPGLMFRIAAIVSPHVETGGFNFGDQHLGFVTQFRLTHEALTSGGPLPVTLAEARQSLEVLTAAYWSAYTGEPVMLPIEPDHPFYRGWASAFAERAEQQRMRSPACR